jgi:predicted dehydrogenase
LRALAASDQLIFGSIGCGARGRYLLTHFRNIAGARCGALCDLNDANLAEAQRASPGRTEAARDYRHLLDRRDIQAVVIATPPHTHFPIARDALLAGKHVFCENTLVFKPEEVHALRELAGNHDQVIQTGLQRRYIKFYQVARQMAAKGFLGDVTNMQAQWHRNRTWTMRQDAPRESNRRLYRQFSGGLTAELAAHQIDMANWVFNDAPEFVTGVGSLDWKKDGRCEALVNSGNPGARQAIIMSAVNR